MSRRRAPILAVCLLLSACSQETTVASQTEPLPDLEWPSTTDTVPPTTRSEATTTEPSTAAEESADPEPTDPAPTTLADAPAWLGRRLASALLTTADLATLELGNGWEHGWSEFDEVDDPSEGRPICGAPTPAESSSFLVTFEDRAMGSELLLIVMPDDETTSATAVLDFLEGLASCPELDGDLGIAITDDMPIPVTGAERSVVLTGVDASSPDEPIGLTIVAAEADDDLFMVYVTQERGDPEEGDVDLAIRAVELVLSRR